MGFGRGRVPPSSLVHPFSPLLPTPTRDADSGRDINHVNPITQLACSQHLTLIFAGVWGGASQGELRGLGAAAPPETQTSGGTLLMTRSVSPQAGALAAVLHLSSAKDRSETLRCNLFPIWPPVDGSSRAGPQGLMLIRVWLEPRICGQKLAPHPLCLVDQFDGVRKEPG